MTESRARGNPAIRICLLAGALAAALAALAGCSEDTPGYIPPTGDGGGGGGGQDSTLFAGFALDAQSIGRLDVTIETTSLAPRRPGAPRAPLAPGVAIPAVPARGVLKWPSGNVALSGVYNFSADTLYLTGVGFTLRGAYSSGSGSLAGSATTPYGPGAFLASHGSTPRTPWCGRFHSTATADSGTFGFIVSDTTLAGMAYQTGATAPLFLQGEVSKAGSPKTLFFDFTLANMFDVSGAGTLNETTGLASGSYSFGVTDPKYGVSNDGTWSTRRR